MQLLILTLKYIYAIYAKFIIISFSLFNMASAKPSITLPVNPASLQTEAQLPRYNLLSPADKAKIKRIKTSLLRNSVGELTASRYQSVATQWAIFWSDDTNNTLCQRGASITADQVFDYLVYRFTHGVSSLDLEISALKYWADVLDWQIAFPQEQLSRFIKGVKQSTTFRGHAKLPLPDHVLTIDNVLALSLSQPTISQIKPPRDEDEKEQEFAHHYNLRTLLAVLFTAFFGCLRVSEYTVHSSTKLGKTCLQKHVKFCISPCQLKYITIAIHGKGKKKLEPCVLIKSSDASQPCPYSIFKEYWDQNIHRDLSKPVFIWHSGTAVTKSAVRKAVKMLAANAGLITRFYSSHSLRKGGACYWYSNKKLAHSLIERLGRWATGSTSLQKFYLILDHDSERVAAELINELAADSLEDNSFTTGIPSPPTIIPSTPTIQVTYLSYIDDFALYFNLI